MANCVEDWPMSKGGMLGVEEIREVFDRALNAEIGVRVPCHSRGAAINLRSRFNYIRKLDRQENAQTYPPGHSMHGKSQYDQLILRIPGKWEPDSTVLYIEHRVYEAFEIENVQEL